MNFLITGSSGFIGQNLVLDLKNKGHFVIGIDIKKPKYIFPDKFIQESFCNLDFGVISKDINVLVHLAADGGVPKSVKDPLRTFDINVTGFINMIEKIIKTGKHKGINIIYASSGGTVVGDSKSTISEASIPNPKSPFGISKYCTELLSNFYSNNYDINLIGLRFTNVYGPMMDQKPNLISKLMLASLQKDKLEIFGDGNHSRDFIYVEDVIKAISLSLKSKFRGVLLIGSGNNISVNEIIKQFLNINKNKSIDIKYLPARVGDVLHVRCDCSKALEKIGFKCIYEIDEGLTKTYEWFKKYY